MWRWGVSASVLALALGAAGSAFAQTDPSDPPPPIVQNVDANGVNLTSGAFDLADRQAAIGPAAGGLARVYENMKAEDNYYGGINSSGSTYTVSVGSSSETFTKSGATYTIQQATGSTLTVDGTGEFYTYVTSNGTAATFDTAYAGSIPTQANVARLTSIKTPTGETTSFSFQEIDKPIPGQPNDSRFWFWRQAGVSNNRGLSLTYNYQDNSTNAHTLIGVQATNSAPGASGPFPAVTFSGTAGGTATDALGRVTTYTLPAPSSTQTITRPAGDVLTVVYDSSSRVTSYSNGVGSWTYTYTAGSGTLTVVITDPNGDKRTVVSNTSLDLITSDQDGLSRAITYGYDTYGRLTSTTYPLGEGWTYQYDARGNLTQTTRVPTSSSGQSATVVSTAGYDTTCSVAAKCNEPNWTKDAKGAETDYTYDTTNGTGLVLTVTRPALPNGVRPQTRYTYSQLSANVGSGLGSAIWLLTQVSSCNTQSSCSGTADETRTTIAYDANHNLAPSSVTAAAGDGSVSSAQSFTYDSLGNLVTSTNRMGAVTSYIYDADREVVGVVGPDPDGSGPLTPSAARVTYNADGAVIQTEKGTVKSASSSDWANFSSATQQGLVRDSINRLSAYWTNGGGVITGESQYSYDNGNRLICSAVRMNPGAFGSQSNPCAASTQGVDGPDRITLRTYDAADELTQVTDGYGTALQRTQKLTYAYVPGANLVATATDAKGNVTTYGNDGFDRRQYTWYPSPSNGQENTSDYEALAYDANNNVTSRRLRDGTTLTYAYDALNRLSTGADGATYTYDNAGRVLGGAYGGSTITLTYDALGRKVTESNPFTGGLLHAYYYASGQRGALFWPSGYFAHYDYDLAGNLSDVEENGATSGVGVLGRYVYDSLGRRTNAFYAGDTTGNVLSQGFLYDAASRPSITGYVFGDTSKNQQEWTTYNAAQGVKVKLLTNNLYDWSSSASVQQSYGVNGLDQVTTAGSSSFTYDARGNLTSDGTNSYHYDVLNRLTSVNAETLSYDAFGRLTCTSNGSAKTCYLHDGADLVGEYDGSGNVLRTFVAGDGGQPLVWYEGSGTGDRRWLLRDRHGSVISVANSSGQSLATDTYDAYGLPGASNLGRFQYSGYPFIAEIGLYATGARAYSPTLGRFLQTDPIGYGDGMNWYAYTHGDPVNFIDPTGLSGGCDTSAGGTTDADGNIVVVGCQNNGPNDPGDFGTTSSGSSNGDPGPRQRPMPMSQTIPEVVVTAHKCPKGGLASPITNFVGLLFSAGSYGAALGANAAGAAPAPQVSLAPNGVRLTNSPVNLGGRAVAIGNFEVFTSTQTPGGSQVSYTGAVVNNGRHEDGHTYQATLLQDLFLPAEAILSLLGNNNPLEVGADQHALSGCP